MSATNYLSGLASNFDWATLIDQIMAVERRKVDVVSERRDTRQSELDAWTVVKGKLTTLSSRLNALRTVEDFNKLGVSASSSSAVYDAADLISLSVGDTASPGNHIIEMGSGCQLAQARQVSSQSYEDSSEALGLSGEFVVNGRAVKVEVGNSLLDIADRVNALNSGSQATHVTASVLAAGAYDYRLVLTSDNTGEDAFSLQEGNSSNILLRSGGLGFFESYGVSVKHATSDGAESDRFSSASVSVKSLLGLTSAAGSTTVQVGGHNVVIDLSSGTETLTSIAATIDTALGASGSAEVVSETKDGVTTYRIDVSGTTSFSDTSNVLQTLGFIKGTQTSVAKSLLTANALTTASSGGATQITAATTFDDIYGYTPGTSDTITIGGYTHGGTALTTTTFNVYSGGVYKSVDDLLTAIEGAYTAAGATVSASVSGGKIQVVDATTGSSRMSLTLTANNEGGGGLNFGAVNVTTQGYAQETAVGRDAVIIVDGVYVTDSSNTISDAVEGLDIDLLRLETGTTVNVAITRDWSAIQSSVQGVVDAYNDILGYVNDQFTYNEETKAGGVLMGDFTLRDVKDTLQETLGLEIPGLPAGWNALSLIGVESDSKGILAINSETFDEMARDDFMAFRRVLGLEAITSDADIGYVGYTSHTQPGAYAINITQAATQATDTGWKDLTSGIGATAEKMRITDSLTGRQATLTIDPAGNGASISALVNALNSEFANSYAQVLVGSVANTKASGGVLTADTTWNNISGATLSNGNTITFEGTNRAGSAVSGYYTISDTATSTVQGLLSAIEDAYGGQAAAYIDASGRLVVQDTQSADSSLAITTTTPAGSGLSFGNVDVTEGAGDGSVTGRSAMGITASDDGSGHLVLTNNTYGSAHGFTVEQVAAPSGANQAVLLAGTANYTAASGGSTAATAATSFNDIYNYSAATTDTITIAGTGHDGAAITPVVFNVYAAGVYKTLGDLLTAIEGAYSAAGYTVTASIENGRLKLVDSTTGLSGLGLSLTESCVDPTPLDLGVIGSAATGLTNGERVGLDVAGTINGEECTGTGRLLTGDAPAWGETSSVEGLMVRVNLTAAQLTAQGAAQGTVTLTAGAMERLWRALDALTDPSGGAVTLRTGGLQDRIDGMADDISAMEARLEQRRETLTKTYTAMEQALSHLEQVSSWLSSSSSSSR